MQRQSWIPAHGRCLAPPRIEFAGANYHIVTRGDGRRKLFHDTGHYERFSAGLEDEVQRSGWIVLAYCWMPNRMVALVEGTSRHRRGTRPGIPDPAPGGVR